MYVVGVDPGLSGAVALVRAGDTTEVVDLWDMPTEPRWVSGRGHVKEVSPAGLMRVRLAIAELIGHWDAVFVEDVHSMPKQGVRSTFSFGRSKGVIEGAFALSDRSVTLVSPMAWKRYHGLVRTGKGGSRALAALLFPASADLFRRVRDDGRAEAALIALYGAHLLGGGTC